MWLCDEKSATSFETYSLMMSFSVCDTFFFDRSISPTVANRFRRALSSGYWDANIHISSFVRKHRSESTTAATVRVRSSDPPAKICAT